jgi:EAL domain-containing protein (putative c-di-GMP-specific phosphodiesterase class I)
MTDSKAAAGDGQQPDTEIDPRLQMVFQPVVDLYTSKVAGFEALARWSDRPELGADAVFAEAAAAGLRSELDWRCRLRAIEAALAVGLPRPLGLFVNVEVATLDEPTPVEARAVLHEADRRLRLIYELTERDLLSRPTELLDYIARVRAMGHGIALDDVGISAGSIAMLPFIAPDVIKLDRSLVQATPGPDEVATVAAVMAHAERTGAALIAEGIETPRHLRNALALGARFGQGWLLGRPGALTLPTESTLLPFALAPPAPPVTPFALLAEAGATSVARKELLVTLSRHLEDQARSLAEPPVVLAAFQSAEHFGPGTAVRFAELACRCPLVVALGAGLPEEPARGVRGGDLAVVDPLRGEWALVVVGSHFAAALIARSLGDQRVESEQRFRFAVTHDREIVIAAGRALLQRVSAQR